MDARAAGKQGEDAAARFLIRNGYDILTRNYAIRQGEVDIIAEQNGVVVFAEVKARSGDFMLPREAVDARKQRRIIVAAQHYLGATGKSGHFCRFDVIEVYADGRIEHIEDAFEVT